MRRIVFIFLMLILFFSSNARAQNQISYARPTREFPAAMQEKLNRNISLDLREINVLDVLKFLATKADLNIVANQNIQGRVTLFLKEVTIASALEIVLLSTNLGVEVKDGILYIMTEEEYAALYGESYRDQRDIKIIQMKFTDADKVGTILTGIKSAIGKIIVDKQTGTLVLIDTKDKLEIMMRAVRKVDIPTVDRVLPVESEVFELSYGKSLDLQPQVTPLLTTGVGTVQVDTRTNRLYVTDLPHALKKIRKLVKAFDRKTRQVYIESRIIQIILTNQYQMGIDWEHIVNEGRRKDFNVDLNGNFSLSSTPTQFGRLILGNLGRDDFLATIDLLHEFGDAKTLASPQLTVENNEEANILVGSREAYVTSTVSQADSTTTTSESITFVDVGVQLKVQPTINKDRFISIKITPEVSSVSRTLTTSNDNEIPIVDTTTASTRVLIKDGRTVMIGGLMKDEVNRSVFKFPILGDLPFIGAAFRMTDDTKRKTELIIFLTPHIVEGDEPVPFAGSAAGKQFGNFRSFPSDIPKSDPLNKTTPPKAVSAQT